MKDVTVEEFQSAYMNENYNKVMNMAAKKFRWLLDEDIELCKAFALWKSLRKYDESCGAKFTTFLYNNMHQKCWTEYNKKRVKNERERDMLLNVEPRGAVVDNHLFTDIMMSLTPTEAKLIDDKFIQNKSLVEIGNEHGITPQRIHQRLQEVKEKIRVILST
jgi:RNA polymerase sigma factor (sigma-70 family)